MPAAADHDETSRRLQDVFRDVLAQPDLVLTDGTTAADVEGWDSLAHIGLMFSIEQAFGIVFSDREMSTLQDVGGLRRVVEAKRRA